MGTRNSVELESVEIVGEGRGRNGEGGESSFFIDQLLVFSAISNFALLKNFGS